MADRIISRLFGGAGNQLFQYAVGRALADRLDCDLVLDTRYVAGSADRGDCFGHFQNARFAPDINLPPAKSDGILRYGLWRKFGQDPKFYRERGLGFDPSVLELGVNTYLHGYWQSQKYFASIVDQLRRDLAFTTELNAANSDMAEQISAAKTPVAVHVRRGDYIASGSFAACSPAYYRAATELLADKLGAPLTCFVISNDPDWARENLDLGQESIFVDINDEKTGHFDLRLMSLCAHNIIANSTFSWWGAWLNNHPGKLVIAPRDWFAKDALSNPDICPEDWLRL